MTKLIWRWPGRKFIEALLMNSLAQIQEPATLRAHVLPCRVTPRAARHRAHAERARCRWVEHP